MAKACGVALDERMLSYSKDTIKTSDGRLSDKASLMHDKASLDERMLIYSKEPPVLLHTALPFKHRGVHKKTARRIAIVPEKILDAPGLKDDFYLNLLHWSSSNLLAVGLENTVYIWNATSGSVTEFCKTSEDEYISSLKWAADGSYLAIGTSDGDAQIWDVDSCAKVRSMKGHTSRVGVLSWDKHILSSGAQDGSIFNHDVRVAKHKVGELMGHTGEVCGLEWRLDGNMLASGGNDNLVQIWDARSSLPRATKTNHMAAVKVFTFKQRLFRGVRGNSVFWHQAVGNLIQ